MRAELLSGKERRRLWRYEDKVRIVEETVSSGMTIADVARRNDVGESLVYAWRRQAREGTLGAMSSPRLVPVQVSATAAVAVPAASDRSANFEQPVSHSRAERCAGLMEIELGGGRRIRVDAQVDVAAFARVLAVLERR
jgi:transposase